MTTTLKAPPRRGLLLAAIPPAAAEEFTGDFRCNLLPRHQLVVLHDLLRRKFAAVEGNL
jgi:hypothetical protein